MGISFNKGIQNKGDGIVQVQAPSIIQDGVTLKCDVCGKTATVQIINSAGKAASCDEHKQSV